MQTMKPHRESVHKVCMQTCRLFKSLHSLQDADFSKKVCFKSTPSLHQVCIVCTCSASSLHKNGGVVWGKPPVLKNADLMHTFCRNVQTLCRSDADKHKSLRLAHFFLSYAKYAQDESCRLYAHFCRYYADTLQTLCRLLYACASGTLLCYHHWQIS